MVSDQTELPSGAAEHLQGFSVGGATSSCNSQSASELFGEEELKAGKAVTLKRNHSLHPCRATCPESHRSPVTSVRGVRGVVSFSHVGASESILVVTYTQLCEVLGLQTDRWQENRSLVIYSSREKAATDSLISKKRPNPSMFA